jgi:uncharacterized protein (DUF4415 family)
MPKAKKPTRIDDSPELTKAEFARMVPFSGLPAAMQKALTGGTRGPQKAPKKVPVTIRLSPEVVAKYKATGEGWQTRIDAVLRESLEHPLLKTGARRKAAGGSSRVA